MNKWICVTHSSFPHISFLFYSARSQQAFPRAIERVHVYSQWLVLSFTMSGNWQRNSRSQAKNDVGSSGADNLTRDFVQRSCIIVSFHNKDRTMIDRLTRHTNQTISCRICFKLQPPSILHFARTWSTTTFVSNNEAINTIWKSKCTRRWRLVQPR